MGVLENFGKREWRVIKTYFANEAGTFIPKGPYLTVLNVPSRSFRY